MKIPTNCRECGSTKLFWDTHNKTNTSVGEGRLRSNEVSCVFVLGCEECSETLYSVTADRIASHMNGLSSNVTNNTANYACVALPDLLRCDDYDSNDNYPTGWNACREEVAKLNKNN